MGDLVIKSVTKKKGWGESRCLMGAVVTLFSFSSCDHHRLYEDIFIGLDFLPDLGAPRRVWLMILNLVSFQFNKL